jgi:hypothetical protein
MLEWIRLSSHHSWAEHQGTTYYVSVELHGQFKMTAGALHKIYKILAVAHRSFDLHGGRQLVKLGEKELGQTQYPDGQRLEKYLNEAEQFASSFVESPMAQLVRSIAGV